jgi:hypothetical protein
VLHWSSIKSARRVCDVPPTERAAVACRGGQPDRSADAAKFKSEAKMNNSGSGKFVCPHPKAECLLLATKGKYYYGETFNRLIEIEEWEYQRVMNNPYLYYFSTALQKHGQWCIANRKGGTLTFAEALGYSNKRDAKTTKAKRNVSPTEKIASSSKRRLISAFRTWFVKDWKEVRRSLLFWVQLCSGTITESEKSESAKQFTLQEALSGRVKCFW